LLGEDCAESRRHRYATLLVDLLLESGQEQCHGDLQPQCFSARQLLLNIRFPKRFFAFLMKDLEFLFRIFFHHALLGWIGITWE
jgi:hypothetical protein